MREHEGEKGKESERKVRERVVRLTRGVNRKTFSGRIRCGSERWPLPRSVPCNSWQIQRMRRVTGSGPCHAEVFCFFFTVEGVGLGVEMGCVMLTVALR